MSDSACGGTGDAGAYVSTVSQDVKTCAGDVLECACFWDLSWKRDTGGICVFAGAVFCLADGTVSAALGAGGSTYVGKSVCAVDR